MRLVSFVSLASLSIIACSSGAADEGVASTGAALGACNLACIQGMHCVVRGQNAQCVPDDPCAVVRCASGYHCDAKGGTAACVADARLCRKQNGCGPSLGMPNTLCSDGTTVSGPTGICLQGAGGCYWEVISCP